MTREKSKVAATRHAKHEWSLKRKALAVTLSIALLGLGTPAVSFADSAADQQSKAVEAQETTSTVSVQEQAPASAEPAQQVVASSAALGGDAAVDNDVATDSKAEVDGVADNAAAPASSENASGAASKNELSAPASSDDPSSDKSSASDEASSKKDATDQIEVASDESGYYVYLYTKVVGNTDGLTLKVNGNGWYTIGRVWVDGISAPTSHSTGYATSGDDYNKVISALRDPSKVELYGVNTINLEDIDWSVENQSTGLKTASGAVDYDASNNYTWHLDGYVDLDKVGFGSIRFHYKDKETDAPIAEDKKVTAEVTGDFNFSKYIISIEGYTYVEAVPFPVVVEKNITKEVTLYYTAKQGKVGYYLADPDATWTAPDNTVRTEDQKWYYNYGFAKGDTVLVTKNEPTAKDKVFIGWLDKERGDQTAAIREAGDIITYIYDGAKTYTLDALWASLAVTGYKDTYDGKEHGLASVDIAINEGSKLDQKYQEQAKDFIKQGTVQYSTDGGETWSDVAPKYKDAGTYPVKVKVDVTVGARIATLEATANIEIAPATLTVTTPSDSRPYNGQPLTAAGTIEGFVNNETAGFATTGSQTTVGESDNTYAIDWEAEGATAKKSNYKIVEKLGELVIAKRDVTLRPADAEKPYDGKPLTASSFVVTDGSFAEGEGVESCTYTGSQTLVGSSYSAIASATALEGTNLENYNVKYEEGKLTVTNRAVRYAIVMQAKSGAAPYSGQEQSVSGFESDVFEFDGVKYTVSGLTATAKGTDAGTHKGAVEGTAVVTDPDGNDVTAQFDVAAQPGELIIGQRVLTLTSASDEKPYDGNPLVRNSQDDVAVTGDGFAEGEGAVYDITGSQTQAGSSKNGFTYELKGNTKAKNYQIAKVEGDLTVKPVEAKVTVTVKGNTGTRLYSGAEQSVEGYTFVSADNPLYAAEADVSFSGDAVAKGTDAGKYPMGLEASQFSNANKNFANVEFVVEDGSIVIAPATLTVTTPNATRVYNGQPLTAEGTIEGFVNNETADFATTGSQTAVGKSKNSYELAWNGSAKESNYTIAENTGTLTVTAQSIVPDPQNPESYLGVVVDSPSDHVYDSLEHKWVPTVTDKDGKALVAGTDYEVTYGTTDFTNVTGDIVVTITGKGNYSGEVVRNYKITKAPLTVNAKNASRAYNGQPLTAPGTISGLVNGETAAAMTEGSQTEVGSSVNEAKGVSWGTAKEGNYYIAAMNAGLLTVTPKSVVSMTVGNLPDVVYSGTKQAQEPAVNDGDKLLDKDTDYDLTFSADTTNVGVVTVTVTGKGNYAGNVDVSYRIKPATLTVTTPSTSRVYNGQPLTAAGTIEGFVNGETAGFTTTGSQTAVGTSDNTYVIDWAASTTAKQSNYTIVENIGKLTVTEFAGEIVATPSSYKGVYDGNLHGVEVTVTGLPEGYTVKTAGSNATATDVTDEAGVTAAVDYLVIVNAQGEDVTSKLRITKNTGAITIMTAILMVTTPSASMRYDGTALTAEGTIEGFVNGETAGFTTTGSQTVVGESDNTYAIDWEAADATAKQSNYTIVEKLGTLKVTPNTTSIVVTPKGGTKVYDGTPLESAGIDEIAGLPKGFALTAEVVGFVADAGYAKAAIKSFVITNAAGEDVTNQFANVATGEATLVVTPRPVTVASADATKVYNGTELVKHEAKVSDGELVEGEEFDYEFFGMQTDAGVSDNTFAVKPGNDATKLGNYEIAYDRGALTVTPAPYSVTTESATKVYDGTALTAGGKIEGLLEGETASLKVTGSQTKVGASENAYTIEWTGTAKESNYKLESESIGTLTVTAAPDSPTPDDQSKDQGVFNGVNSGLVQTGDATGIYGVAAIIAAAVAAFVSLLAVRRRKE